MEVGLWRDNMMIIDDPSVITQWMSMFMESPAEHDEKQGLCSRMCFVSPFSSSLIDGQNCEKDGSIWDL